MAKFKDGTEDFQDGEEYIKQLDERIFSFTQKIADASYDIKEITGEFTRVIDELKQNFIASIVQKKVAEKRFELASTRLETVKMEYDRLARGEDSYLIQSDERMKYQAYEQVSKMTTELSLAESALAIANREYMLNKEVLLLRSKKEEHHFCDRLNKLENRRWFDNYVKGYAVPVRTPKTRRKGSFADFLHKSLTNLGITSEETTSVAEFPPPPDDDMLNGLPSYNDIMSQSTGRKRSCSESNIYTMSSPNKDVYSSLPLDNPPPYRQVSAPCLVNVEKETINSPLPQELRNYQRCNSYDPSESSTNKSDVVSPMPHIYEDVHMDQRRIRTNSKPKKKKKGLMNFLKKRIHGPWEGWEDD